MDRNKILWAGLSLAFGLASWAVGEIVENLWWLPFAVLPVATVLTLAIGAQFFFDWRKASKRVSLPGFGFHFAMRVADIPEHRRQYFFDFSGPNGEGGSFYLSASKKFVFSIHDNRGEPYALEIPVGWRGFPIAHPACFGLEAGTDGAKTVIRAMLNGRIVAERTIPFGINFGEREIENATIGASRDNDQNAGFDLYTLSIYSRTLDDGETDQLVAYMSSKMDFQD